MTTTDQPTDARERLLTHFSKAKGSTEHGQKWDELYKARFLPWDKGFPNPALVDLLNERSDLLSSHPKSTSNSDTQNGTGVEKSNGEVKGLRAVKSNGEMNGRGEFKNGNEEPKRKRPKALVPGCGKGYDVLLLAAYGYDAYGLEISPSALEEARKLEREMGEKGDYVSKMTGGEEGSVTWVAGDFFEDGFLKNVEGEGKFVLIYDYTFLSALPPEMRPAWAKRFNELLAPDGRVVCVEFPTYKPPSTGGPPWALPPKIYMGHLPRPGKDLPYAEDGELIESELGEPSPDGLMRIEHFQPKRTHNIGYNAEGKVTDWVSIWAHSR